MDNNGMDNIIENGIKNALTTKDMEMDVRQSVMARIENYETAKAEHPGIVTILLYIYSFTASLLCIIFFDKVSVYFKPFLQSFPSGNLIVEAVLRGIFIFIPACLLIMAIYYRRSPHTGS